MPIYTTALLHDYQPPRRLCDVLYQPLETKIDQSLLIPDTNGSEPSNYNEEILKQSYAPRAFSGLYSKVGFNIGPTLLSWMVDNDPVVAKKIIESDKISQEKFEGHGNAVAQASWNHVILPLASEKDIRTQIRWGIKSFINAFGRYPEGVWLPEAAVNYKVLEALSDQNIKFVILSPFQASKIKPIHENNWWNVNGGKIDPSRAYKIFIPNTTKSISAFFYDKEISPDISFPESRGSKIYQSSNEFVNRLKSAADWRRQGNQLIHFATDGETFGHHHKDVVGIVGIVDGAYDLIDAKAIDGIELMNYGLFLEKNPPTSEVQIFDNTAWSCGHGLGRWGEEKNKACTCPNVFNSDWRVQLRQAFDFLKGNVDNLFEDLGSNYLNDPWEARDDYISVVLGKKPFDRFLQEYGKDNLSYTDVEAVHKLLEMEKFSMLMYTSCAWFFNSVNEITSYTSLIAASSALELYKDLTQGHNTEVEKMFMEMLHYVQYGSHDAFNNFENASNLVKTSQYEAV